MSRARESFKMFLCFVICAAFATLFGDVSTAKQIPKYITRCKRDAKLNECYKQGFNQIVDHLDVGIPELFTRSVDPLLVESLHLNYGGTGSISFNADLNNMKLYGLNKVHLDEVSIDLENPNWNMNISLPALRMESDYKAKGKVLLLQFDSAGIFWGNYTDLLITGNWLGKKYTKKGKEHIKFTSADIDIKIKNLEMYFDNLFPNNEQITVSTNKAINDNIDSLYDEIKPIILETVKTIILDVVNSVYNTFPIDYLYPKD